MAQDNQIPVYLFTGFLDAGKTTFIQSTLEDKRFNEGQRTLLIRCEEGEEEYDSTAFSGKNVFLRDVENEEDLTEDRLADWLRETRSERVMIECNGMWQMQSVFDSLPDDWIIAQEICFAEAGSIAAYNANMRNLVFDKFKTCNVMVFNRCADTTDTDALHKIVRQANRRCNIFYEYPDGRSVPDEKEDPLPFDIHAPVITIEDRDYAYFFADLMENPKNYDKKTVEFLAMCPDPGNDRQMPDGMFIAGRPLMNCCAADTQMAGLPCYFTKEQKKPAKDAWIRLKAKIRVQRNSMFSGKVPLLDLISYTPAEEPEEPVATFY